MFKPRAQLIEEMDIKHIVFSSHDGTKSGLLLQEDLIAIPEKTKIEVRNNNSIDSLRFALDPDVMETLIESKETCDFCGDPLIQKTRFKGLGKQEKIKYCTQHGENIFRYTISFNNPYDLKRNIYPEGICTGAEEKALKTENLKPEENDSALLQEEIDRISRERDLWKMASELFFQALKDARITNSTAGATKRMPPV